MSICLNPSCTTPFCQGCTAADKHLQATDAIFNVQNAISKLREARELLKAAGAMQAANKVRHALKSAEGAERHAYGKRTRLDHPYTYARAKTEEQKDREERRPPGDRG